MILYKDEAGEYIQDEAKSTPEHCYIHYNCWKWSVSVYKQHLIALDGIRQVKEKEGYSFLVAVSPQMKKRRKLWEMSGAYVFDAPDNQMVFLLPTKEEE